MFTHEINVQSSSNRDIVWALSSKLVALTSLMHEQVIPLSTMYSSHNDFLAVVSSRDRCDRSLYIVPMPLTIVNCLFVLRCHAIWAQKTSHNAQAAAFYSLTTGVDSMLFSVDAF